MQWVLSRVIFFFLLVLSVASPAAGKEVLIEYQTYTFDNDSGLHYYKSPRVTLDEMTISGEEAEFDKQKNTLEFKGNIVVYSKSMLITANRALVDIDTSINTLFNTTFYDQKNGVHGTAEKMEQLSDEDYILYQASLSSCNPKERAWEMESNRIVYEVDNFAYSTNTALWFHSVPIFYTPFLSWPTTQRRTSGLLPPLFTHHTSSDPSKAFGSRLQIPYFIALDRDHDLTVTTDIIERRGTGVDLSYRYAFVEGMSGVLRFWYLDESVKDRDFDDEVLGDLSTTNNSLDPRPKRDKYSVSHKQNIFLGGTLTFTQLANSDNEVNKEYFDSNVDKDYRFKRTIDTTFPWDSGSLSIKYETTAKFTITSIYDNSSDEETRLNTHPSISVNQRFTSIADTPFSLYTSGSWTNYERIYGWNGIGTSASVKLTAPFHIDFLNISPSLQRRFYHYNVSYNYAPGTDSSADIDSNPDEYGWMVDTKTLEFNFEIFRYFLNEQNIKTAKLSFTPRIILKEEEDIARPENESNIGSVPKSQKSITYRLETRFKTKDPKSQKVTDLLQLNLTQPFNLNADEDVINPPSDLEIGSGDQRLPLRIELIFKPSGFFSGSLFYRYHHQEDRIAETKTTLRTSSPHSGSFALSYHRNEVKYRDLDNVLHSTANKYTISSSLPLSDRVNLSLSAAWDQNRGKLATRYEEDETYEYLDRRLTNFSSTLTYKHSCYNFAVSYAESIDDVTDGSITKEELRQKVTISLTIPFIPSAAASGLGELQYRESFDNE